MEQMLYIADRATVDSASDLIARLGDAASDEAAARADRYRDLGNAINFCRWRQIERIIHLLTTEQAIGTVH